MVRENIEAQIYDWLYSNEDSNRMLDTESPRQTVVNSILSSTSGKHRYNTTASHGTIVDTPLSSSSATFLHDDVSTTSNKPEAPNLSTNACLPSPPDTYFFRRYYNMPPQANQDWNLTTEILKCLSSHGLPTTPELKVKIRAIGSRHSLYTYSVIKGCDISRVRIARQKKMITVLRENLAALEAELEAQKGKKRAGALQDGNLSELGSCIKMIADASVAGAITFPKKMSSRETEELDEKKKKETSRGQRRPNQAVLASGVKKNGNFPASVIPRSTKKSLQETERLSDNRRKTSDGQQDLKRERRKVDSISGSKKLWTLLRLLPLAQRKRLTEDTGVGRPNKRKNSADDQQESRKCSKALLDSDVEDTADAFTIPTTNSTKMTSRKRKALGGKKR